MEDFDAPGAYAPAILPPSMLAAQSVVRFRAASAGYTSRPDDDPANVFFPPRLLGDIEIGQSAIDGFGIGGRMALTLAEFDLWDGDRSLLGIIVFGLSDGRPATIRQAVVVDQQASHFGTPYGTADVVFSGLVRRIDHADGQRARVSLTDISERLASPLQLNRFAGTGGLEGPAALVGQPKPVCLGTVFNLSPVPLGNVNLGDGLLPTYAVHWRSVSAVSKVRIRGVEQAAFSPPGVGQFKGWPVSGVFQIGSTPDGAVTADVMGDASPAFVGTHAGIIRRLITSLGPGFMDAEIQTESFAFADTDMPGTAGWYRGANETTGAAAVDEILASCGAVLAGGRGGTVRLFDPLATGDAQFLLPEAFILDLQPIPFPAALRPLPRSVAVDWQRNWTPLTDLAGSADAATLNGSASGPARASSLAIATRVAQNREMHMPGLYALEADALFRAERWRALFEASPRAFRLTTDRYLGQIECGDLGAIAYPAFGLENGAGVVVLGWREALGGRRLSLDLVTVPWVVIPPVVTTGEGLGFFILDVDELA